jgi:hypothetical protein
MIGDKQTRLIRLASLLFMLGSVALIAPAFRLWHRLWKRNQSPLAFALMLTNGLIVFIAAMRALDILWPVANQRQREWRTHRVGLIVWAASFLLSLVQYGLAHGRFRQRPFARL